MAEQNFLNTHADLILKDSFSVTPHIDHIFNALSVCRIDYHRIFLLNNASGTLIIDGVSFPLNGQGLFLLAKGQVYAFEADSIINGYELSFGDCFWERAPNSASNCKAVLFNNAAANQSIDLSPGAAKEMSLLFEVLYQEFIQESYINKLDVMAAYLKIIMIKIANLNAAMTKGFDSYERQLYHQFVELLSTKYQNTHEVADFAAQLGISARKLSDLCKRCCGKGAKDIINGQLVAEAKRALQFSAAPVKEIAYGLNFSSPDQFSHFFKKYTARSPNDYREQFVKIDR